LNNNCTERSRTKVRQQAVARNKPRTYCATREFCT